VTKKLQSSAQRLVDRMIRLTEPRELKFKKAGYAEACQK
jgi:hypothetical protein